MFFRSLSPLAMRFVSISKRYTTLLSKYKYRALTFPTSIKTKANKWVSTLPRSSAAFYLNVSHPQAILQNPLGALVLLGSWIGPIFVFRLLVTFIGSIKILLLGINDRGTEHLDSLRLENIQLQQYLGLSEISSRFGLWSTYRLDPISLAVWNKGITIKTQWVTVTSVPCSLTAVFPRSHLIQTIAALAFSLSSLFKKVFHFFVPFYTIHYTSLAHFFVVILLLFSLALTFLPTVAHLPPKKGQCCVMSG